METNPWLYKGKPVEPDSLKGFAGFVYIITDLTTKRKYIGKKTLVFVRKLKKTDKRRTSFESDWATYYGSSKELTKMIEEKGKENFKREIIAFGKTRGEVNFAEVWTQFFVGVLESDNWINDAIGKYKKTNIKKYVSLAEIKEYFKEL